MPPRAGRKRPLRVRAGAHPGARGRTAQRRKVPKALTAPRPPHRAGAEGAPPRRRRPGRPKALRRRRPLPDAGARAGAPKPPRPLPRRLCLRRMTAQPFRSPLSRRTRHLRPRQAPAEDAARLPRPRRTRRRGRPGRRRARGAGVPPSRRAGPQPGFRPKILRRKGLRRVLAQQMPVPGRHAVAVAPEAPGPNPTVRAPLAKPPMTPGLKASPPPDKPGSPAGRAAAVPATRPQGR